MITDRPWFAFQQKRAKPHLRLFCFPYAGGGASLFRTYPTFLPAEIEVCPVQLPGRENRLHEPLFYHLSELIDTLTQVLHPYLDLPYAFFGHSMGALISFELAHALRRQPETPGPLHLFVSGRRAPQIPDKDPPTHDLPEPLFLEKLRELGGTPEEVLKQADLLQIILPILRADFALCETYRYMPEPQDQEISLSSLEAWKEQTLGPFKMRWFVGDHFFLHQHQRHLLAALSQELRGAWLRE